MKKHKKIIIAIACFVLLIFVCALCVNTDFNRKGIASGMRGLVSEDTYPNWASDEEVSELDCNVLDRSGLSFGLWKIRTAAVLRTV